jgi:endonuclease/exonuclease/phosphatase family metal-dependent hydrolase
MLLRVATFNVSLHGRSEGDLLRRLDAGDADARRIAAVIQRQRPDLLLLNEFDYDQAHAAADRFQRNYLEVSQFDQAPIPYPYRFLAPVNTGVLSGLDLNGDGKVALPEDGWGFGNYPGQYGMLVLSRYPIDVTAVRTFQKFAWSSMPGALMPRDPAHNAPYYPEPIWTQLRLSSKSHWDIPIDTPGGRLHFLVSHPTPPVFDGPENRNGLRNHDEIRFWADYVSDEPQQWLLDDAGGRGGLDPQARFVIAGDQNADPVDGDTVQSAILQLIEHPRVLRYSAPRSAGGARSGEMASGVDLGHRGPHAHDTGSFGARTGNLRVDYVLPSREFAVAGSGVFWPLPEEPEADWLKASDHRMVWLDLKPAEPGQ